MANDNNEISQETFEQIESYLLGQMEESAKLQFEERMAADQQLAAEVALQQQLFAAVETGSLFTEQRKAPVVKITRNYTRWYMAASVLLLVGIAAFWFLRKGAPANATDLYAAYFEPDPGLPVEMGSADTLTYRFYDGMISYKEGKYTDALAKWRQLDHVNNDTLQYYRGMAHLNNEDPGEAINMLKELVKRPEGPYYQEANWYLALAYLKKGDKKGANACLERISSYPGVADLMEKLKVK